MKKIGSRVFHLLPSILIQILTKIALSIKDADPNQWKCKIGSRFQMVAGKDAESAGKYGYTFMNSILHGKIGDDPLFAVWRSAAIHRRQHLAHKTLFHTLLVCQKAFVF